VAIDDHAVVQGKTGGVGAYVVWNCRIQTLEVRCCQKHLSLSSDSPLF
jgi:hypothetical protein